MRDKFRNEAEALRWLQRAGGAIKKDDTHATVWYRVILPVPCEGREFGGYTPLSAIQSAFDSWKQHAGKPTVTVGRPPGTRGLYHINIAWDKPSADCVVDAPAMDLSALDLAAIRRLKKRATTAENEARRLTRELAAMRAGASQHRYSAEASHRLLETNTKEVDRLQKLLSQALRDKSKQEQAIVGMHSRLQFILERYQEVPTPELAWVINTLRDVKHEYRVI